MKINRITVYQRLQKYTKPVKGSILALMLTSLLTVPLTLISPKFYQILIDEVMGQKNMGQFYIVVFGLIMVYVLQFLLDGSSLHFGNRVLNSFTLHLRKDVLEKYQKLPYSFFEKKEPGDWKMRLVDDIDCLGRFIRDQVIDYLLGILTIGFTLFMAFRIDIRMTFYCLLVIPFVFFINYLIGRGSKKVNEEIRKVNEEYYTSTHNSLQFWREIKAQNAEKTFIERFRQYRKVLAKLGLRSIRYWGYSEVFNDFKANYLTKVMVYIIGAFFVINRKISVGGLIMFSEYFAMLFSSLDMVNSKRAALKANTPYYRRIFETLDFPEEAVSAEGALVQPEIEIKNLSFSYRPGEEILKNVSLTINQGDYIAIVGKTGCGKTTLAKLLLGLYEPDGGEICFGGKRMELVKKELYGQVGVVMQDSFLFNMSIRENLQLANRNATENDFIEACRRANIYGFVQSLEQGFDTVIGERGVKLSGGQKQRLAIAAALLKSPRVLLFDEATSSLDKASEDIINDAIHQLAQDTTVIIISHRPASVRRAKKVVVLEDGAISAVGTPDELVHTNAFYRKIAEAE